MLPGEATECTLEMNQQNPLIPEHILSFPSPKNSMEIKYIKESNPTQT